MVRTAFTLSLVPLAMLALASFGRTQAPSETTAVAAPLKRTPHHKADRLMTFSGRWVEPAPVKTVLFARETPSPTDGASAVPVADQAPPTPPRHRRAQAHGDICERHGLHKVWFTKKSGWRYWRCQG
jgi:hypothetical protein